MSDEPFLRPPRDPRDAATRAELIARALKQRVEVLQYFDDIAAWNAGHPGEAIDPDPDGMMASLLAYLNQFDESAQTGAGEK